MASSGHTLLSVADQQVYFHDLNLAADQISVLTIRATHYQLLIIISKAF